MKLGVAELDTELSSNAMLEMRQSLLAAGMDIAAEEDVEANKLGQPALAKLKMLPHLHAKVAERKIHDVLMDAGILGCLKAWIEPMPGGHLPNSKVCVSVLSPVRRLIEPMPGSHLPNSKVCVSP